MVIELQNTKQQKEKIYSVFIITIKKSFSVVFGEDQIILCFIIFRYFLHRKTVHQAGPAFVWITHNQKIEKRDISTVWRISKTLCDTTTKPSDSYAKPLKILCQTPRFPMFFECTKTVTKSWFATNSSKLLMFIILMDALGSIPISNLHQHVLATTFRMFFIISFCPGLLTV